ncbi:hypothetical protein K469DRAFT_689214 [Zopfia rhizophila CBS 207.26]|uniref:Uncharacterized protein n=1 Tax=Zopfia rhizophila CBS 207.26 TaxID=1314779 RepID=A0A6A6ES90_9PEZI|nr:hypothetical protein K469DRAFT_689214 [Zopfia rhizophila CBS 207.26]
MYDDSTFVPLSSIGLVAKPTRRVVVHPDSNTKPSKLHHNRDNIQQPPHYEPDPSPPRDLIRHSRTEREQKHPPETHQTNLQSKMLPSPTRTPPHKPLKPSPSALPFTAPPSRLILHSCPYLPVPQTEPAKPLTALLISLPLAQKIHQLLRASRQVEMLARRLFTGSMSEHEVAREMDGLEERYEMLREEVEGELEAAWIGAGFLSPGLSVDIQAQKQTYQKAKMEKEKHNTIDASLKRKREQEGGKKKDKKKKGMEVEGGEEEWHFTERPEPIGIMQAMIPLKKHQKKKLTGWNWRDATTRLGKRESEECAVSPMGTKVFW